MSCSRCNAARIAVTNAARSLATGDLRQAREHAQAAASELAAKAKDEAARVRALIRR